MQPISVTLPDGNTIQSTHTGNLQINGLPPTATTVHLFPQLGHTSLVSIGKLCDAGCQALFDKDTVTITYRNDVLLTGQRNANTNQLWQLTLPQHQANITTHTNIKALVQYSHAALFSPVLSTLETALRKGYVKDLPGLTLTNLRKHPPVTPATAKGHIKQTRQGVKSTKNDSYTLPLLPEDDEADTTFPQQLHDGNRTHHAYAAVIDRSPTGKIFTDQTGRFVIPSSTGNNYLFVLYDYDSNYIDAVPIPNRNAKTILTAFKTSYNRLINAGLRPKLHRLDNECSNILKEYLHEKDIHHQLAPPGIHRRNAAERAIQTLKDHLIAGLSTADPHFPLHLWDQLLPQALLTLNLLRGSRLNPKLSAYMQLHGAYDFNATPIAPPGVRVVVHTKPDKRRSWAPRGTDAWYIGPSLEHYRCYKVWNWTTKATQIADTVDWFPTTVTMPTATQADAIEAAINDIKEALQQPHTDEAAPVPTNMQTITEFTSIFPTATTKPTAPVVRVEKPPDTTYNNFTWQRNRQNQKNSKNPKQRPPLPHQAHKAINPDTGQLAELPELLKSSVGDKWDRANALEWGRLANGCQPELPNGSNAIRFINYQDIPQHRRKDVTYIRQVTADRPFKTEKERVRATAGGDRINYPYDVSTKTSDIQTAKMLFNSTISTKDARFMVMDIKDFYLSTKEMIRKEYARVHISKIPQLIIDQYKIMDLGT